MSLFSRNAGIDSTINRTIGTPSQRFKTLFANMNLDTQPNVVAPKTTTGKQSSEQGEQQRGIYCFGDHSGALFLSFKDNEWKELPFTEESEFRG